MNISDIMWATMVGHIRQQMNKICDKYETDSPYKIRKFYDKNELKGFCVYHDSGNIRCLDEAHYIGVDKFVALKMWKWLTKDAKTLHILAQKSNEKMWAMYMRMGFDIIQEDEFNYLMER